MNQRVRCICFLAAVSSSAGTAPGAPAVLPVGFAEVLVCDGLTLPTSMAFAPDGRLFVTEKGGQVRVVENGALLPAPFASVSVSDAGERGLLGLAFDPELETTGRVYVYYSADAPRENRVSRFVASALDPNVAEASETPILTGIPSDASRHQGGAIHFGPDGMLYAGVGDDTAPSRSQDLTTLSGKLLRIDPRAHPGSVVPPDNPFTAVPGARGEIWALGLRNPFTFAIHPQGGTLLINDVGEGGFEEVNVGVPGGNYGWPDCEGPCSPPVPSYLDPVYSYSSAGGAALSGGVFYTGNEFPEEYHGNYFFADFVRGFVRRGLPDGRVLDFATDLEGPVDLDVGPDGNLYYLSESAGEVYRVFPVLSQSLGVNQTVFSPGETLSVSVEVTNLGGEGAVDFYFGAILPDGDAVVVFRNLSFDAEMGSLQHLGGLGAIAASVALSGPFVVSEPVFFSHSWEGTEPAGTYGLFLAAVVAGSLGDGAMDPGDIVRLSLTTLSFIP